MFLFVTGINAWLQLAEYFPYGICGLPTAYAAILFY
jgi:hypothetical protein